MDVPLDELGRRQASALGQVPRLRGAARVVSSPLARARDTAAALGPPVTVDDRWAELDYGIYDGSELSSAGDLWARWDQDLAYAPPGGESIAAMGQRVRKACEEMWEEAVDSDVVVVSHVSPIKAAVAWALDVDDEICWRTFLDVASVTAVGSSRGSPTLRSFNEIHHRPSE
jgi:broad specificity phosphatase PhoE